MEQLETKWEKERVEFEIQLNLGNYNVLNAIISASQMTPPQKATVECVKTTNGCIRPGDPFERSVEILLQIPGIKACGIFLSVPKELIVKQLESFRQRRII